MNGHGHGSVGGSAEALRIRLLGGFRISIGERTVGENAWRLRKAASLVKLDDQDATNKVQDANQPQSAITAPICAKDETIAALRERLEQANERQRENWRIITALTSRILAIDAPSETSEAYEAADEQQCSGTPSNRGLCVFCIFAGHSEVAGPGFEPGTP